MCSDSGALKSFEWIDLKFVQDLISKSDSSSNWEVKSFDTGDFDSNGQNFSSFLVRLVVDLRDREVPSKMSTKSFFVKGSLNTEDYANVLKESLLFVKEIEVYTKILPAVEELLASIGKPTQIGPKCYYADVDRCVLVLEDLGSSNFVHADKAIGLDIESLKLNLTLLAKWHAATAVLLLKRPELFEWNTKVMYKNSKTVEGFFRNTAKGIAIAARKWHGFEGIADKVANIPDYAYTDIYKEYMPLTAENSFNTLIHGDLWSSNILFNFDENKVPIETRWVDFALCKHTKPTFDLTLLLYSTYHDSITQDDRERLIQFYHSELSELLQKMDYPKKIPSLLDIHSVAFRMDLYNSIIILLIIGLRYVGISYEGGFIEMSENMGRDDNTTGMYTQPECRVKLQYLLEMFNRRGYFDF